MNTADSGSFAAGSTASSRPAVVISERDIVFNCPNCQGELVVDRDGAGLSVPCSHCGNPLTIPEHRLLAPSAASAPVRAEAAEVVHRPARQFDFGNQSKDELERRFNDLKHQLKENRSQDTEMRGHVNRATMELHRLQLKLKKLQERHLDIGAEIHALAEWLDSRTT